MGQEGEATHKPAGTATPKWRDSSDRALVLAVLAGIIPAFDELVRRYRPGVVLTARQVLGGDRSAAEDVAQEVFVLAFKALPQLEEPEQFPAWLRAICRRRALRAALSRKATTQATESSVLDRLLTKAAAQGTEGEDPARTLERCQQAEAVWLALSTLPPEQGEPLFLLSIEDWDMEKIAAYLSVPASTVRGRIFRGRQALRRRFDRDGDIRK